MSINRSSDVLHTDNDVFETICVYTYREKKGSDSFYLYNLFFSTSYLKDEFHIQFFVLIIRLDSMEAILYVYIYIE